MKKIDLERIYHNPTLGILSIEGKSFAVTLELPWKDNEHNISCIPTGNYECIYIQDRYLSTGIHLKEGYELLEVPNREGILIHCGNTAKDTKGCILVGTSITCSGEIFITQSRSAMDMLMRKTKRERFMLCVFSS